MFLSVLAANLSPSLHAFPPFAIPSADPIDSSPDFPQGFLHTFVYVFVVLSFYVPSLIFKSCFSEHPTAVRRWGDLLRDKLAAVFTVWNPLYCNIYQPLTKCSTILFSSLFIFSHYPHRCLLYFYFYRRKHNRMGLISFQLIEIWIFEQTYTLYTAPTSSRLFFWFNTTIFFLWHTL